MVSIDRAAMRFIPAAIVLHANATGSMPGSTTTNTWQTAAVDMGEAQAHRHPALSRGVLTRGTYRLWLRCAFIRFVLCKLGARQIQYLAPPSVKVYAKWVSRKRGELRGQLGQDLQTSTKQSLSIITATTATTATTTTATIQQELDRVKYDVEVLGDRKSSLMWLGRREKAGKVVLFFHGGGYIAPLTPGHVTCCWNAYILPSLSKPSATPRNTGTHGRKQDQLDEEEEEEEIAVAMLAYTLAPGSKYPEQLSQAAAALEHLLSTPDRYHRGGHGFKPSQIIIGGDSAGGNLAAALLSHLLHPCPHARPSVPRIRLEEPLAAAFLVSPLASRRDTSSDGAAVGGGSARVNRNMDMLSPAAVDLAARELMSDAEGGGMWGFPADHVAVGAGGSEKAAWFKDLGKVAGKVYITAGKQELLLDQCVRLAGMMGWKGKGKKEDTGVDVGGGEGMGVVADVRLNIAEEEAHDFILVEAMEGMVGDATTRMIEWVGSAWEKGPGEEEGGEGYVDGDKTEAKDGSLEDSLVLC
ncbi:hypothetical protein MKZ38_002566 [Zalerion maritima]|uniref:Alpha/beta hydrolase fold-3 domain-containing protein n=1 Tax=Zalerion maritima TaxID=339359 RepID=A0AAD5RQ18_9PEZI|nr:hypothetical protein MKZ38_002566 [Zalerion maritima]